MYDVTLPQLQRWANENTGEWKDLVSHPDFTSKSSKRCPITSLPVEAPFPFWFSIHCYVSFPLYFTKLWNYAKLCQKPLEICLTVYSSEKFKCKRHENYILTAYLKLFTLKTKEAINSLLLLTATVFLPWNASHFGDKTDINFPL